MRRRLARAARAPGVKPRSSAAAKTENSTGPAGISAYPLNLRRPNGDCAAQAGTGTRFPRFFPGLRGPPSRASIARPLIQAGESSCEESAVFFATLAALLLGTGSLVAAKDAPAPAATEAATGVKNVAVVSIAGYDRIFSDVAFIGQIIGKPGLEKQADAMVMLAAQGLTGMDRTRPWGLVVNTDGESFSGLAFVPVTDLKALLASVQGLTGPANDEGNGIFSLEKNNQQLFIKEQQGWAYLGQTAAALGKLPPDPLTLLGGLDKQYEIAIRFRVANVPEMFRSLAIDQMRAGLERGLEQQPGEDDDTFEERRKAVQDH